MNGILTPSNIIGGRGFIHGAADNVDLTEMTRWKGDNAWTPEV